MEIAYVWILMLHQKIAGTQMETFVAAYRTEEECEKYRKHFLEWHSGDAFSCERERL
jgi:hypothetical protein